MYARWLVVCGEEKQGKHSTSEIRAKYSHYFIVTSGRDLLLERGRIVIDEFHRLGEPFFSALQGLPGKGKLILIAPTRYYFREVVGSNSPLLGLFYLRELGLVDPRDAINFVSELGY
ncbi:hypothetical protein [Pyrococcus kukulkanii]|uniref:hypothetical protein n=1 Tax=Pyrococcus kukulkanii TaxID=1609559 RepID=UPI00356599B2